MTTAPAFNRTGSLIKAVPPWKWLVVGNTRIGFDPDDSRSALAPIDVTMIVGDTIRLGAVELLPGPGQVRARIPQEIPFVIEDTKVSITRTRNGGGVYPNGKVSALINGPAKVHDEPRERK